MLPVAVAGPLLLRALVALLEIKAELLKKASDEQVQKGLDRCERFLSQVEAAMDRIDFWNKGE